MTIVSQKKKPVNELRRNLGCLMGSNLKILLLKMKIETVKMKRREHSYLKETNSEIINWIFHNILQ